MESRSTRISYERRLMRVTSYLHEHLDDALDLDKLAEIACMSPYHWHRIYQGIHGESVVATVKRLRLQRAATLLSRTTTAVDEIAALSGYPNVQSFTRIFSSVYGMPPARYRKEGSHTQFPVPPQTRSHLMFHVDIKTVASIPLLCIEHTGSYMGISKAFDLLNGIAASRQLFNEHTRWIGIFFDDPCAVEESALRSRACISIPEHQQYQEQQTPDAPLVSMQIEGGRYAVLRYRGPYSDMQPVYQWFYGTWLPASGHEAADAPPFEDYLNNPRETPPADLLTDIYMRLR
ncbi:AraC family transcriptional regulator [Undibacterium sp. SXout7W]|uniref:AraC family transcriptional regulator n=1 Tax=Undibacterium sp. SXout7W TaxID=3413049 RepID=UPI003BF25127